MSFITEMPIQFKNKMNILFVKIYIQKIFTIYIKYITKLFIKCNIFLFYILILNYLFSLSFFKDYHSNLPRFYQTK